MGGNCSLPGRNDEDMCFGIERMLGSQDSVIEWLACWMSVMQSLSLVRVSVALKRHHDHNNSYKHFTGLAHSSEVQSIIIMAGSMAVCRQTWCWLHLDQKKTGNRPNVTLSEA